MSKWNAGRIVLFPVLNVIILAAAALNVSQNLEQCCVDFSVTDGSFEFVDNCEPADACFENRFALVVLLDISYFPLLALFDRLERRSLSRLALSADTDALLPTEI